MTPKMVKRQLEKKLHIETNILDQSPWKQKMKKLINEAQEIFDQNPISDDKEVMASAEHSAVETSSETSDLGDKVVSKRKLKRKGSSKASERASGTESKGTTDTNSEDEDARPAKRSKTTNATKTSSKKTPKTSEEASKSDETIKRLKNYIHKCGVRKIWSKELADCETTSSQIARLKSILHDLGVQGRPTLEKCEAVKSERELKAEIESLSTENILPSNKRSTRSELPSEYTAEAIAEEVEEAKKNDLDLGFLGDQSSDSD
ncbi:unnamed protein product [Umbelopsis vinacea]